MVQGSWVVVSLRIRILHLRDPDVLHQRAHHKLLVLTKLGSSGWNPLWRCTQYLKPPRTALKPTLCIPILLGLLGYHRILYTQTTWGESSSNTFHIYNINPWTDCTNPLALANQTLPSGCRRRCHLCQSPCPSFRWQNDPIKTSTKSQVKALNW